jgi:beta-glucosidase
METKEIGQQFSMLLRRPIDLHDIDRKNLTAWHGGDDLILAVAAQNNNTIVVVHSVGPLILEPWIEHPNVTAVRT